MLVSKCIRNSLSRLFAPALAISALLSTCLLAAPAAHAGYYSAPTYSGGTASGDFEGDDYDYDGTYWYGGQAISIVSSAAICTGQITAHYVWVPTSSYDPPPQYVIVHQICDVYAEADGSTPSADADNGLGGTPTPAAGTDVFDDPVQLYWTTSTLNGDKWSVHAGGSTVDITCTPDVEGAPGGGGPTYDGAAEADVWYHCDLTAVQIGVSNAGIQNTDDDGHAACLIGQKMVAGLNGGSAGGFSGYSWTVSGGLPFASYVPTRSSAAVTWCASSNWSSAAPWWYYSQGAIDNSGISTVDVSATALDPNGNSIGTVTATKDVEVWSPQWTTTKGFNGCYWDDANMTHIFTGIADSHGSNDVGAWLNTNVWTNGPFSNSAYGGGSQIFIQLINATDDVESTFGNIGLSTGGNWWLDNKIPYATASVGYSETDHVGAGQMTDAPGQGADNGIWYIKLDDYFKDYVLYLPPGDSDKVMPVPIIQYGWEWHVEALYQGSSWSPAYPASPGYLATSFSAEDSQGFWPEWDTYYSNSWF